MPSIKYMPLPAQRKVLAQVNAALKTNSKVVVNAICSFGKTFITLWLIKQLIAKKKRVAIVSYARKEIREHWWQKILKYGFISVKDVQIICSPQDIVKLTQKNAPGVTNSNVSKTKPITIFIPQSLKHCEKHMGMFDYVFIDECHEWLDTDANVLQSIIQRHSLKDTKVVGLSGTAFETLNKDRYFQDAAVVIYDLIQAFKDDIVANCTVSAEYFNIHLKKEFYKGLDLNNKGRKFIKNSATVAQKVQKIVNNIDLKEKTLIVVPPTYGNQEIGTEEKIANLINAQAGKEIAVVKSSRVPETVCATNDARFRHDKNISFLVVVNMCGVGWDYPELRNVIDLTFTKNTKTIIQRLSRAIRKNENKVAHYYYCADNTKDELEVQCILATVFEMMTKEGILNYANQQDVKEIDVLVENKKHIKGNVASMHEHSIDMPSLKEYTKLKEDFEISSKLKNITHKQIHKVNLKSLYASQGHKTIYPIVTDIIHRYIDHVSNKEADVIKFCTDINKYVSKENNSVQDLKKCIKHIKKKYSAFWKKFGHSDLITENL